MGAPTIRSVGTFTKSPQTVTLTPPLPAGYQADDTLVLVVSTEGTNSSNVIATPSGWLQVSGSPATRDVIQVAVFYKTAAASETAPTFAALASNSQCGVMICIQGAETIGTPVNVAAAAIAGLGTSVTCPSVTTTTIDTLIMNIVADRTASATARYSGWTNAALAGLTEIVDDGYNLGNANGFGVAVGSKATAGSTGSTTTTLASSSSIAMITIAFEQPSTDYDEEYEDSVTSADADPVITADKSTADTATPADAALIETGKNLSDTATAADEPTVDVAAGYTETVGVADAARVSFSQASASTVTTDDVAIPFSDPNDTATAGDDVLLEAGPALTDTVFAVDSLNIGGFFITTDDVSTADNLVADTGPALTDAIEITDAPVPVQHEAITTADEIGFAFGREFTDSIGAGSSISFETAITTLRAHPKKAQDIIAQVTS